MTWPRTLFGRLVLVLALGLLAAQALTFALVFAERGMATRGMMLAYLTSDVASSVAMLDRLPAAERTAWLDRLQRPNYRLGLGGPGASGAVADPASVPSSVGVDGWASAVAAALSRALSQPVAVVAGREPGAVLALALSLKDGSPVRVDIAPPRPGVSPWLVAALLGQLALLVGACWLAVRQATRPLAQLAAAARALKPGQPGPALPQGGPREVAEAAQAFDQMRQRIAEHLEERVEMLGAISHDLQTPVTRMRLRAEMLGDPVLRDKLQADLGQMQHLVDMGLAYARTSQAVQEPVVATDLAALLASLVADYQDAAQAVTLHDMPSSSGAAPGAPTARTRPQALRRALANLVDNALKFAGAAELALELRDGSVWLQVMDRGPGIPPQDIAQVTRPFYRVEGSRNRATGGTGLGLAIVQRLLLHCQGELVLAPRAGGGLVASIRIPA